jgi:uncharacterized protein YjbI with pentapeptide repeats
MYKKNYIKDVEIDSTLSFSGVAVEFANTFQAANNQISPVNITNLLFPNSTFRSFIVNLSCTVSGSTTASAQFTIEGIQSNNGWQLVKSSIGDTTGLQFYISNTGQVQYTSTNYTGWTSTIISYQAIGYTKNGVYGEIPIQTTGNLILSNKLVILNEDDVTNISSASVAITGGLGVSKNMIIGGGLTLGSHLIPNTTLAYDLGSSTNRWRDLYLSGNTIDLGGVPISTNTIGSISFGDTILSTSTTGANTGTSIANISSTIISSDNITTINLVSTNISTNSLNTSLFNPINIQTSNLTVGNIIIDSGFLAYNVWSINSTLQNIATTNISAGSGNASIANIVSSRILTTNLLTTNASISTITSSLISTGTLLSSDFVSTLISTTNLLTTNISSANISVGNLFSTNISSANISSENLLTTNISSANISVGNGIISTLTSTLISTTNLLTTNISSANISSENLFSTNISSANISVGNGIISTLTSTLISTTNLLTTNISSANISVGSINIINGTVLNNLVVSGTLTAVNITNTNLITTTISAGSGIGSIGTLVSATLISAANLSTSRLTAFGAVNTIGNIFTTGGSVGIGNTAPSYKLDVVGDIYASGDVISFSDKRLKSDIITINNAVDLTKNLRGVFYTSNRTQKRSVGVIAQEVQMVLPEAIADQGEYLGVCYGNIVGVLIEAVKELSERVSFLESKLSNLSQ